MWHKLSETFSNLFSHIIDNVNIMVKKSIPVPDVQFHTSLRNHQYKSNVIGDKLLYVCHFHRTSLLTKHCQPVMILWVMFSHNWYVGVSAVYYIKSQVQILMKTNFITTGQESSQDHKKTTCTLPVPLVCPKYHNNVQQWLIT